MSELHAETVAFVRDSMLPRALPPPRDRGVLLWLRENLFSGWFNTLLTVLGVAILWYLLSHLWPWLANAVWRAENLGECRQIIAARAGEGAPGACFAVIRERWHQYLFGFYPRVHYWRPVLAFGALFIALGPVLFSVSTAIRSWVYALAGLLTLVLLVVTQSPDWTVVLTVATVGAALLLSAYRPRPLLVLALLYPALGVWLLWGGTLWGPLSLMAGLGVFWLVSRALLRVAPGVAVAVAALATVAWWLWLAAPAAEAMRAVLPLHLAPVPSDQFGGFLLSVTIGVAGIVLSLPLGIVLALARRSDMFLVTSLAVVFIEFVRGVPLIALLFVASLLLNYFLPPGTTFDIILRVIIMVTLFAAAYMAEVIRGGLAALPRGQYEAADSLGLNYWQAQRLIILPQALRISIPGIVSTFIGMFKDTTLVVFVGLFDPLKGVPDFIRSNFAWKGTYWEHFVFVGSIFFVICFAMSRYSMYLERRLTREHN